MTRKTGIAIYVKTLEQTELVFLMARSLGLDIENYTDFLTIYPICIKLTSRNLDSFLPVLPETGKYLEVYCCEFLSYAKQFVKDKDDKKS